jgi:hypothetical protein
MIENLPAELVASVLSYLPIQEIMISCMSVNHAWQHAVVAHDEIIWRPSCIQLLSLPPNTSLPIFNYDSWGEFFTSNNLFYSLRFSSYYNSEDNTAVNIELSNNNLVVTNTKGNCETIYCSKTPLHHINNTLYYIEVVIDKCEWISIGFAENPTKIIGYDWIGYRRGQIGFANDNQAFKHRLSIAQFTPDSHLFQQGSVVSFAIKCETIEGSSIFTGQLFVDGKYHTTFEMENEELYFGVTLYGQGTQVTLPTQFRHINEVFKQVLL